MGMHTHREDFSQARGYHSGQRHVLIVFTACIRTGTVGPPKASQPPPRSDLTWRVLNSSAWCYILVAISSLGVFYRPVFFFGQYGPGNRNHDASSGRVLFTSLYATHFFNSTIYHVLARKRVQKQAQQMLLGRLQMSELFLVGLVALIVAVVRLAGETSEGATTLATIQRSARCCSPHRVCYRRRLHPRGIERVAQWDRSNRCEHQSRVRSRPRPFRLPSGGWIRAYAHPRALGAENRRGDAEVRFPALVYARLVWSSTGQHVTVDPNVQCAGGPR